MKWVYGRSAFVHYVITKFSCFHMLPIYLSNRAPPRALCAWELRYKQKNLFVRILLTFHLCASQSTWNTNIWPWTWRVMSLILVWRNIIFLYFQAIEFSFYNNTQDFNMPTRNSIFFSTQQYWLKITFLDYWVIWVFKVSILSVFSMCENLQLILEISATYRLVSYLYSASTLVTNL